MGEQEPLPKGVIPEAGYGAQPRRFPMLGIGSEFIQNALGQPFIEDRVIPAVGKVIDSVVKPVGFVAGALLGSVGQEASQPKTIIFDYNPETGEYEPAKLDDMKPVAQPKTDLTAITPPYEGYADGTTQAIANYVAPDGERPASNQVVGDVARVLLNNNGVASIKDVARQTGQELDFVRGHGILTNIFRVFRDPETEQDMIEAQRLKDKEITRNEDGWTIVVTVSDASAAD